VVLSALGAHAAAIEKLEAALASDAARKATKDAIASRLRLALALRRKGDLARAREESKKARAEAEPTKDVPLLVEALLELSSAELGLKAFEPALAAAKDAVTAAKDDSRLLARTTLHSAVCARAIGKKETARAGFKMARELAEAAGESVLAAAAARELKSLE
jgi:tetratricopeptide (TPR) repeat protein